MLEGLHETAIELTVDNVAVDLKAALLQPAMNREANMPSAMVRRRAM